MLASVAQAATVQWDGEADDGRWSNPRNWSGDVLPQSGDAVVIERARVSYDVDKDNGNLPEALDIFQLGNTDLIITDLHMTMLDGIELTKMIRTATDSAGRFMPIILLTAHTERSHIVAARDAGVTEICAKPFTPLDLHVRITACVNKPRDFVRSDTFRGPDRRRCKGVDVEEERREVKG